MRRKFLIFDARLSSVKTEELSIILGYVLVCVHLVTNVVEMKLIFCYVMLIM